MLAEKNMQNALIFHVEKGSDGTLSFEADGAACGRCKWEVKC